MTPLLRANMSTLTVIACAGLALTLPAFAASNPNPHKEIQTAAQHAEFALKSKNTAALHQHLHHVINCIVGSSGEGFDAAAGNPCQDMGNGALNDASGSKSAETLLNQSLSLARTGVDISDQRAARSVAIAAKDLLKLAEKDTVTPRK